MSNFQDYNFKDKQAVVRVDFNVPLNEKQEITDTTRIKAAVPTIQKILEDGGRVVLLSHLGRPNGQEDKFSLRHIVKEVSNQLDVNIQFAKDCIGDEASQKAKQLQNGEVLLLENLRFHKEEKAGDKDFAKQLSQYGDVYVNDAFGAAHRAHASTAIIAQYFEDKFFGHLMAEEIENAETLLNQPEKPFVVITGGAKVSDKIAILQNLIGKADHILIGGGMAYTFIKAQGGEIGASLFEEERVDLAKELLNTAAEKGTTLHLPIDSLIADEFSKDASIATSESDDIPEGWMGLDIGPDAIEKFSTLIVSAKSILWNGPMGVFEMKPFSNGTKAIAAAVAKATKNGAYSLIGGGDSAAAINQFGYADDVSHVSTGGGALLELFEGKELPGIESIKK